MKTCSKCRAEKPCSDFYSDKAQPDGLNRQCRRCRQAATRSYAYWRAYDLKRLYGITREQWEAARISQDNACASCREPFTTTPHTDHCHTTHKFRGLLCNGCNTSLGLLKESPARMHALADYISRH